VSLCNSHHWQSTGPCWPGGDALTGCGCSPTVTSCFGTKTCWKEEYSFQTYQSKPSFGNFVLVHHCWENGANTYSKTGCSVAGDPPTLGYIAKSAVGNWTTKVWTCRWTAAGGVLEQFFTFSKSECSAVSGTIVGGDPFGYVRK